MDDKFVKLAKDIAGQRKKYDDAVRATADYLQDNLWNALGLGSKMTGSSGAPQPRITVSDAHYDAADDVYRSLVRHREAKANAAITYRVSHEKVVVAVDGEDGAFEVGFGADCPSGFVKAIERALTRDIEKRRPRDAG